MVFPAPPWNTQKVVVRRAPLAELVCLCSYFRNYVCLFVCFPLLEGGTSGLLLTFPTKGPAAARGPRGSTVGVVRVGLFRKKRRSGE